MSQLGSYRIEKMLRSAVVPPEPENEKGFDHAFGDEEKIAVIQEVAYKYICPLIFVIGIFGTIANLVILSDQRRFKDRLYLYMKALSMVDLSVLGFAVSSIIHILQQSNYRGSKVETFYEAHIENVLLNGSFAASVFIIVLMTIDR